MKTGNNATENVISESFFNVISYCAFKHEL